MAVVTVPWEVYKRTGKLQIVQEYYQAARMFVEFLNINAVNKSAACPMCAETEPLYTLWSTADWLCCDILPQCGDFGQPGRCNSNCPHTSASAFSHVLATARLVDMASAIGNTADATYYKNRLALLKAAYHQRFFVVSEGKYAEAGTASWIQSHQVFVSMPANLPSTASTSQSSATPGYVII